MLRGGRVVAGFRPPIDFAATLKAMIGRPIESAHPDARPYERASGYGDSRLALARGRAPDRSGAQSRRSDWRSPGRSAPARAAFC